MTHAIHVTAMVHPKAHVENATIGRLTRVWQFASVIRHARVLEHCNIASCAIVDGARIGARSSVSHGAFVGPGVAVGEDVFIGPHVSLCNDVWPRVAKAGFDLAALISGDFVTTRILNGASIGASVVVLPGITIGQGAMISAGAVVTADVPAQHLWLRDGSLVPIDPDRTPKRMRRSGAPPA